MSDAKMRNIGPRSSAWLRQVGIHNIDDLRAAGPVETFLKVKRAGFRPSLNLLYSLVGALIDCHWSELPVPQREALQAELAEAEVVDPIRDRWDTAAARSERIDGSGADDVAGPVRSVDPRKLGDD